MEADWDLHAVVRGCAATTATTTTAAAAAVSSNSSTTTTLTSASSISCSSGGATFGYPMNPIFEAKGLKLNSSIAELHELCKPNFFFPKFHFLPNNSFQLSPSSSSSSSSSSSAPISSEITQTPHLPTNNKHSSHAASLTAPRSKRRKNQLKRVCHVPAEAVSSDIWAWRKYGQKPIKGSPYPRCSSSKACLARKQVERNRSDPTMFIVTYTADHNHPAPTHRNSLAGSTRQKPVTPAASGDGDPMKTVSPATSGGDEELASEGTTRSESKEEEEEEENGFGLSDMELTDDFFEGLDELTGSPVTAPPNAVAGECIMTAEFPALGS
ncbi:WRKY transcription factor 22 [Senna tora]|uniref:WRKY transcription factor 22 n=1 Tax=Senna tora TaxID=362788 RepID=A0A834SF02_9FABA|nr:WRKY transcription factor 22 [Senna tora]